MASFRALLCDICIIMLFGTLMADKDNETVTGSASKADDINLAPKGNCSCGGFPSSSIEAGKEPMLSQTPGLVVTCDGEGDNMCKGLCNALAIATKAKSPDVLCGRLKDVSELKLSAFFKVCDRPWTYADITADEPLCCEDSKAVICPSMKGNFTNTVDAKTPMK